MPNNSDAYSWIGSSGSSWQSASDWQDVTSGQNPAPTAPGAGNAVTIVGPTGTVYEVISGGGVAAATALTGLLDLIGSYTVGTLGIGTVQASSSGGTATTGSVMLGAGSSVQAGTVAITDGTLALSGAGAMLSASGAVSIGTPGGYPTSNTSSYSYGTSGTLTLAGGAMLTASANLTVGDGSLSAQDAGTSVTIAGNLIFGTPPPVSTTPPYTFSNTGTLSIGSGASVVVTGDITETGASDQIVVGGAGASLTVAGMLRLNSDTSRGNRISNITASGNSVVRLGGLSVLYNTIASNSSSYLPTVYLDSTASIEVGTTGGAAAGTLTIDAGNTVSETGNGMVVVGTVSGGGTLSIGAGGTLTVNGLAGTAKVVLAANTTIALNGNAAAGDTINFAGAGDTLAIGANVSYTQGTTYTLYTVRATLTGFDTGDVITLSNTILTNAVYTYAGSNTGTLALYAGTTAVETLTLAGNYSGRKFLLAPTTSSGSAVSLLALPGNAAPSSEAVLAGVITSFSGFSVDDPNAQATGITVTLSDSAGLLGVAASGGATVTGSNTSRLTIAGTVTQVDAALATLNYVSASPGTDTITVSSVDSLGSSSLPVQIAVAVTRPPVLSTPASATVAQNQAASVGPIGLAEAGNTAGETFSVTVSDTNGLLATTGSGVTGSSTHTLA